MGAGLTLPHTRTLPSTPASPRPSPTPPSPDAGRHIQCFDFVQATQLAYTYTKPFVVVTQYDTPHAGAFGSYMTLNLMETGTALMRAATRIAARDLSEIASETGLAGSADLMYMFTNGVSGAASHECLHTSLETGFQLSLDTRISVLQSSFTAYISMATVLGSFMLLIIVPILLSVEHAKDAIVLRFIQLPRLVRRSLHKDQESKMLALRINFSDDYDEDEENLPEGQGGTDMFGNLDHKEVDWDEIMARVQHATRSVVAAGREHRDEDAHAEAASAGAVSAGAAGSLGGAGLLADATGAAGAGAHGHTSAVLAAAAGHRVAPEAPPPFPAGVGSDLASPAAVAGVGAVRGAPASGSSATEGQEASLLKKGDVRAGAIVSAGMDGPGKARGGAVAGAAASRSLAAGKGSKAAAAVRARKGCRSLLLLAAKFIGPIFVLFCFFTAIFLRSQQTLQHMLPVSSAQTAASNRASCTAEVIMDLYHMHINTQDRLVGDIEAGSAFDTVNCITYHQRLLLFTTPDLGHGPYDKVSLGARAAKRREAPPRIAPAAVALCVVPTASLS